MPWLHISADITKTLVAHYALDDEAGLIANDSSGKGNNGDLVGYESGNAGWTTGKIGGALSFDGTNDYVTVPHDSDFDLKTYTLSAWVNVASGNEIRPVLVKGKFDDGVNSTDVPFALYLSATKKLTLAYEKSSSSQRYAENMSYEATGLGLTPGEIHHVAVTRNNSGGKIVFYVDGQSRGSFDSTPKPGDNKKKLYLGLDPKTNALFKGGLDDIRIYSQALESSDIQSLYELGTATQRSDPSGGEATQNASTPTGETQNNAESESSANGSSKSETTESGSSEETLGKNDSKNSNPGQNSNESGQSSNGSEAAETETVNLGASGQQTNTSNENPEANNPGQDKGTEEAPRESEGQDDRSGQNGSAAESQNANAPSEDPSGTIEQPDSKTGQSDSLGASDDKSGNSNASTQQTAASNDNPVTNGSDQNNKDTGDASRGDDQGNSSDDSSKKKDSESEKANKSEDETASKGDKENGLSTGDVKESNPQTEQETGYFLNQVPTNITLSTKSIYEGKSIGSIVGRFQVVDPDDPNGEGTYLIELVSNNSAARRVGRSSSATENFEQEIQGDKTSDSTDRSEGKNETDDRDGGATGKQSTEAGKNQEDEKTGGVQSSAKDADSDTVTTKETASKSSSKKSEQETVTYSSNDTKVESPTGDDSGKANLGGWFTIDGEGRLITDHELDYETRNSYSIRVRATDQGGLSVEKDFIIRVKNAFAPIIRTLGVSSQKARNARIKGEILANGYSPISEVGIVISKQPRFKMGEKETVTVRATRISQQFELSLNNLVPETTYYFRSYAINGEGMSSSSLDRFTTSKSNDGPWANMKPIGNGWLHSEWLGHFYPSGKDWVYHEELGWLYATKTDTEGIWLYSADFLGWFWTSPKVYPFVFAGRSRNWAYYQGMLAQHRVFYHFGQNSWMAVSRDISTKKKQSQQASTEKKSSREESVSKQSATSRETGGVKSSQATAKQQR